MHRLIALCLLLTALPAQAYEPAHHSAQLQTKTCMACGMWVVLDWPRYDECDNQTRVSWDICVLEGKFADQLKHRDDCKDCYWVEREERDYFVIAHADGSGDKFY